MGASESKLAFKEDIFRLAREPDIAADSQWWSRFYQLPESADDVFALWSPNDLRSLTSNRNEWQSSPTATVSPKKNIETLIYTCIARLEQLQTRHCFPDPNEPVAPEVLNCVRILTRLLPYIYEAEALNAWEEKFFWEPRKPTALWDHKNNVQGPLYDGLQPRRQYKPEQADETIGRPLGEQLLDILLNYLFFPNFTQPKRLTAQNKPDLEVVYTIWASGIGCKQTPGMTKENERNAVEVLRLLLTMCSRTMYTPPSMVASANIRPLTYLTTQCGRQVVLSLICSLLNTVSNHIVYTVYTTAPMPPPKISAVLNQARYEGNEEPLRNWQATHSKLKLRAHKQDYRMLMYNQVLKYNPASWRVNIDFSTQGAKDPKQLLVTSSLQLLLVLIIYTAPNDEPNAFRKALSRLHRAEDFQFVQQGLTLILTQPVSGMASYFPSNQKALPWASEMLQLFWELLQCNKRFRSFIIDTDRAHDFVVLVLYYAMDAKDEPARQGIVRMCVFILQTLSVEPGFGKRLNKAFIGHDSLPAILKIQNFHGNYADYLITVCLARPLPEDFAMDVDPANMIAQTVHTMITSTKGRLEPIYPALLAVVSNIAAHVHDLQRATSSKMVDLFVLFSAPGFLLANETNHNLLLSLLEAMNAVLEHQYEANRRFVDVVVRSQKRIQALRNFTVERALDELDRVAKERKDRGEQVAPGLSSPVSRSQQSMDSVRSASGTKSRSSLGDVPEDSTFTIGGDDEDGDDEEVFEEKGHFDSAIVSSPTNIEGEHMLPLAVDDAVPVQSRSMSEKARGKQPINQASFSRSTSGASLASLSTARQASPSSISGLQVRSLYQGSNFEPSAEWLSSWIPLLPLETLTITIEFENERAMQRLATRQSRSSNSNDDPRSFSEGATPRSSGQEQDSSSAASALSGRPSADSMTGNVARVPQFHQPLVEKVQTFTWSPLSLGWYTSMLWSWIYAGDAAAAHSPQNGIWIGTRIRLFNVVSTAGGVGGGKISLMSPRGAVDAAGNAIAQRLSGLAVGVGAATATATAGGGTGGERVGGTREV